MENRKTNGMRNGCGVLLAVLASAAPGRADETLRVYHVGNSLTRGLTLTQLHELMATRGIDYQFGAQLGAGVSLRRHWDVIAGTCPAFTTKTWETRNPSGDTFEPCHPDWEKEPFPERFGKYDKALANHSWDVLVLQLYGASVEEDVGAIKDFVALAEKHQSVKRYCIYSTWPRRPAHKGPDGATVADPIDYQAVWNGNYDEASEKGSQEAAATRDGRMDLMRRLRLEYDGKIRAPLCMAPAGDVLAALDLKIKAGELPGLAEAYARNPKLLPGWNPQTGIAGGANVLYADRIHLNPMPHLEGTVGTYAVSMTMLSVLTGRSPVGLSGQLYGFDDTKDAPLIAALQQTVWDVVQAYPFTGIVGAAPAAASPRDVQREEVRMSQTATPTKPFAQPTLIPGEWKRTDPPLPPLAEILAKGATRRPVYGLYCWASEYIQYHDFIRQLGITNLRLGGPMNDACMELYVADEAEVMATLAVRVHESFSGIKKDWRNRATYDTDEAFIADYLVGVSNFLTRWGPGGTFFKERPGLPERPIRFVEVWNEPNFWYIDSATWTPPKDEADRLATEARREKLYAKLLPAAYGHIKKRWPDVQVVGFGAGGAAFADVRFLRNVHKENPEVAKSYDILSTHPYVLPAPPETDTVRAWGSYSIAGGLADIRETMRQAGTADRPIWYTELNWTISGEEGGAYKTAKNSTTALLQAAYWVRSYAWALRLGVERLNFMSIVDTDNCNAGLLSRDGGWRCSAHAVRTMIVLMPHPRLVGAEVDGADGRHAYWFHDDAAKGDKAGRVLMAWKVDGPGTLDVAWSHSGATLTDMLGQRRAAKVEGGRLVVEIGPCPVYVTNAANAEGG